jgi:hypothetical protein
MVPQLAYWLFSIALIIVPFVLYEALARQEPDGRFGRWSAWAAARTEADPEESDDDHLAADLVVVLRRERLVRDLQRVQHLVATDTWMSATRQIGNRMAYEQLLHDIRALPEPAFPGPLAAGSTGWSTPVFAGAAPAAPGYGSGRGSTVETLDVHLWR